VPKKVVMAVGAGTETVAVADMFELDVEVSAVHVNEKLPLCDAGMFCVE
jgi:hypothetical protein